MALRSVPNFFTAPNAAGEWESLKRSLQGDPAIRNLMSNVEQKHWLFQAHERTSLDENVAQLFEMLKNPLSIEFKEWDVHLVGEKTFGEACMDLQAMRNAKVDDNLMRIWRNSLREYAQEKGAFSRSTYPIGIPAIRSWTVSYEGRICLAKITMLNLSGLFLSVFPEEISLCKGLEDLELHTNNFASFAYDLTTWPHLKRCNLSHNRLEYFFEGTRSHPSLKMLDLSSNRLLTFSCNFNGYPKLEVLYLHDNLFESLFCTLTMCSHLKELSLMTGWVKEFYFQLSPDANLRQGPILNMVIQNCGFSCPALRVELLIDVPDGCRLGMFIDDPTHEPVSKELCYPLFYHFSFASVNWKGMAPLNKNFRFALMNRDGDFKFEKRKSWRKLGLSEWTRENFGINFTDISFA